MNRKLMKEFGIDEAFGLEPVGDRFGPDDPGRIEQLENLLGKSLPDDYRRFVLKLAPCIFTKSVDFRPVEPNPWSSDGLNSFDEFHGLEKDSATDLIDHYRDMEEVLPAGMFAIGHDPGARLRFRPHDADNNLKGIHRLRRGVAQTYWRFFLVHGLAACQAHG